MAGRDRKNRVRRKKKDNTAYRHSVELEDGALREISPVYDRILGRVVSEIETAGLRIFNVDNLLSNEFQSIDNLLTETAFAAFLLAYDAANEEIYNALSAGQLEFAEGDKKKPKRRRLRPIVRKGDTPGKAITYLPYGKDQAAAEIGIVGKASLTSLRFDVPPQEAIDYFKRKQILPADKFYALESEARAGAFAISKVYKTDVTAALQNELIDALQTGRPQAEVIKKLKGILEGAGHKMLGDAHLETVFRTTTQMAYGVGRRIAQEEAADYLPIWEYSAVGDDRTRPTHMALDGLQYPVNHPFWDSYYPPWDFRCRCSVIPVFDYRPGYNRERPNDRTSIDYDAEGLPIRAAVDNQVVRINTTKFQGIPRQANLEQVLKNAASRALDSRKP